jgi:hypothetical protein
MEKHEIFATPSFFFFTETDNGHCKPFSVSGAKVACTIPILFPLKTDNGNL